MLSICVKIANSLRIHVHCISLKYLPTPNFTKLCLYMFQPFHGLYIEHAFNFIVHFSPLYIDELCIYNQSLKSLRVYNQNSNQTT